MARDFDAASSEHISLGSALITSHPITMACWFNPDSITSQRAMFGIGRNDDFHHFSMGLDADGKVYAEIEDGSSGVKATTDFFGAAASVGNWDHAIAVYTSTTSRDAYLNNADVGSNTTSVSPTGLNETSVGAEWLLGAGKFWDGQLAELAVWNVALGAADRQALADGACPLFVRPDALVTYHPLIRGNVDLIGAGTWTENNTPGVAVHPRIYYPSGIPSIGVPGPAGGGASALPQIMQNGLFAVGGQR